MGQGRFEYIKSLCLYLIRSSKGAELNNKLCQQNSYSYNYYADYCQNNYAYISKYNNRAYQGQNDKNGHCKNSVHGKACETGGGNASRLIHE